MVWVGSMTFFPIDKSKQSMIGKGRKLERGRWLICSRRARRYGEGRNGTHRIRQ